MEDNWNYALKNVELNLRKISEQICKLEQMSRSNPVLLKESIGVKSSMANATKDINQLERSLTDSSSSLRITRKENERRMSLLEGVISKSRQLQQRINACVVGSGSRPFDSESSGYSQQLSQQSQGHPTSSTNYNQYSTDDFLTAKDRMIEGQDKGIEGLSEVVNRQRQIGIAMNQEINEQNEIIEDIGTETENVRERLIKETANVGLATKKTSAMVLWVIIALLFISIIVVICIPKSS